MVFHTLQAKGVGSEPVSRIRALVPVEAWGVWESKFAFYRNVGPAVPPAALGPPLPAGTFSRAFQNRFCLSCSSNGCRMVSDSIFLYMYVVYIGSRTHVSMMLGRKIQTPKALVLGSFERASWNFARVLCCVSLTCVEISGPSSRGRPSYSDPKIVMTSPEKNLRKAHVTSGPVTPIARVPGACPLVWAVPRGVPWAR